MSRPLYGTVPRTSGTISNTRAMYGGTEPDLRKEMAAFLDGLLPEIAKGQVHVLRSMRRDDDGELIKCVCVDKTTGEPDKDTFCQYCAGEGFVWDETFIEAYKVVADGPTSGALKEKLNSPGLDNIPTVIFYTRFSETVYPEDKIVELVKDKAGRPIQPYKRLSLYRIGSALDLRSDDGRLEYWKILTFKEKRKFLNGYGG